MLAAPLLALALAASSERIEVTLGGPGHGFGHRVVVLGDLDGDRWDDVAVSAPAIGVGEPGAVWVLSGRDGKVLWTKSGASVGDEFGYAIAAIDWNHDGRMDLAVGAPFALVNGTPRGAVLVLSGKDGAELMRFQGAEVRSAFGYAVADVGPIHGGAGGALAIGAPGQGRAAGAVHVFGTRSGGFLLRIEGTAEAQLLGSALSPFGDVNSDGLPDFLVGAPGNAVRAPDAGAIELRDGRTGRVLRTFWGFERGDRLGERIAVVMDVDGDGLPEIAVASPAAQHDGEANVGRVDVLAGRRGDTLSVLLGSDAGDFFGRAISGDVTPPGSGRPLLAVGAPYSANPGAPAAVHPGAVHLLDPVNGALVFFIGAYRSGDHFGASLAVVRTPTGRELWIGAPARGETVPDKKQRRPGSVRAIAVPAL